MSANIRKARVIAGRTLILKDASVDDAPFIYRLRTNSERTQFLSATTGGVDAQSKWILNYQKDPSQAYFVMWLDGAPTGTVRIYDAVGDSFCWGSWIVQEGAPVHVAIESALMVYSYCVDHLGFERAHFDVRRDNRKVCLFHERMGAIRTRIDEVNFFYQMNPRAIRSTLSRYKRYLPTGVDVSYLEASPSA